MDGDERAVEGREASSVAGREGDEVGVGHLPVALDPIERNLFVRHVGGPESISVVPTEQFEGRTDHFGVPERDPKEVANQRSFADRTDRELVGGLDPPQGGGPMKVVPYAERDQDVRVEKVE